jgi:hypothetical protein
MKKSMSIEQVLRVVELYRDGLGCRRISQKLEISEDTCRAILRGRNYKNITGGRLMNGKRQEKRTQRKVQSLSGAGTGPSYFMRSVPVR